MRKIFSFILIVILASSSFGVLNLIPKVEASSNFSFPWKAGTSWRLTQWWHGSVLPGCGNPVTGSRCALDLGSDINNRDVLAMADGTITYVEVCEKTFYVYIDHGGDRIDYLHLDTASFNANVIGINKTVKKGTKLGEIEMYNFNEACGHASGWTLTTGHLHLVVPVGVTIDGWTFNRNETATHAQLGTKSGTNIWFESNNYNSIPNNDCNEITANAPSENLSPVYRFWSDQRQKHFYTIGVEEAYNLCTTSPQHLWDYEGIAYYAYKNSGEANTTPVYRFWSSNYQSHFYTASEEEKNVTLNNSNWAYEGIAFYVYKRSDVSDTKPLYRFWSNNYQTHFYTANEQEKANIIQSNPNWQFEGIVYYVEDDPVNDSNVISNSCLTNGACPLYRFYSSVFGSHFFTTSEWEKTNYQQDANWMYEGTSSYVFNNQYANTVPVYRLRRNGTVKRFYTTSEPEKNALVSQGWIYDWVAFYVYLYPQPGTMPVSRFYRPSTMSHYYTSSQAEISTLSAGGSGWVHEGTVWYVTN